MRLGWGRVLYLVWPCSRSKTCILLQGNVLNAPGGIDEEFGMGGAKLFGTTVETEVCCTEFWRNGGGGGGGGGGSSGDRVAADVGEV